MEYRERNNIARMKCYENKKLQEEALEYEKYVIQYHFNITNDVTYHWKNIPDEWLYESGYIHNYNEQRKRRLLLATDNYIGEYGLDGMTFNKELECYQGIQAKHYNEKGTLTANCLGTFLSSIMCIYLKSNKLAGILYHTCKLQIDFLHNSQQCNSIYKFEKVKFNKIITKVELFKLRDYQIIAINNCIKYHNGVYLTRMACGTGKTTIFSNLAKSYDKIICMSPLKILVDKNHQAILNNLIDYDNIIFDSDHSEIDENIIKDYLKKDKYFISTTFKTARDVFSNIIKETDDKILLIIDEGHNLTFDDKIWDISKIINNSHIFTGTKTEEIDNNIDEEINYLSLGDAIKQTLVCDYQIYLPLIIDGKIDIDYEENEILNESDIETKIMFILKGLLFTASKRCIIYLSSKSEITEYEDIMIKKAKLFHGITLNTFKIYDSISKTKRQTEIEDFEKDININQLNIMFSIRILDEGIDIVKCDSIFITNITENTSEKQTVQRMCRANRLDKNNLSKIANIFIWTDDNSKICNMLNYLKQEDPTFASKIRNITINYDTACNRRDIEKKQTIDNKQYFNTKCMTLSELFEIKFKLWNDFTKENERLVIRSEVILDDTYGEFKVGFWQDKQCQKWNKDKMTEPAKIKFLENIYFKQWTEKEKNEKKEIPPEIKFKLWNDFTKENKRLVIRSEVILDDTYGEFKVGFWQDTQCQKWNKDKMTEPAKIKFLENIYFKQWTEKEKKDNIPFDIAFVIWNEYTIKNKRLAKHREVIIDDKYGEFKVGIWQDKQCQKWNKDKMTEPAKIKFLENIYFKQWTEKRKE
jgi:superfamily II DNA or RNA helicase